ncbi:lipoprotein [Bacillus phage vB_BcoS-136]|uniref:HflK protein n=1 Tax=Bacillus phage vB_BcoS-136 TaxID=2419619 RepID=A0A3G3BVM2_9CAUD|nr:lipoprotein [Bacillus phage vB_BcoS-136]AYP68322.1 HflK protein [Bacillus phage vB_BcoS-136]
MPYMTSEERRKQHESKMKLIKRGTIAGVAFIVMLITWFAITTNINQGHAGVVFSKQSGVQEETLRQGFHFVNPLHRITEYPVSTETISNQISLATKDGKPLEVDITYDYLNDVEMLPYIYDKFKGQSPKAIEESWLKARLRESALAVTSKYTILEVFQKREEISTKIEEDFRENVRSHGFIIETVVFGTPEPDANTAQAIQEVVNRQQELEALKIEKLKADEIAQRQLIEAKGEADAKIEKARGDAESKVISAEAEAEANREIQATITPELLKLREMEARLKHGWIEINGAGGVIVDKK